MTTLVIALAGGGMSTWLVRRARRYAVLDRVRPPRPPRLPAGLATRLQRALDAAMIATPAAEVLQLWLVSGVVVGVLAAAVDIRMAPAAAIGAWCCGPILLGARRHRRDRAVTAAIPDTLERIAAELRAGGTVATALTGLAEDGAALTTDFARIRARIGLGASVPAALAAWPRERRAAGTASAAGALAVAHTQGGSAAPALDSLAASLRERLGVVAEARALSAQARSSAVVVGVGPLAYLAFSALVDRRAITALLDTPVGRVCAIAGLVAEGVGAWWMHRILADGDES